MNSISVRRDGQAWWFGLNRPEQHNALDQATVKEIDAVLFQARRPPCIVIVHSTTPGVFAARADVAELRDRDTDAAPLAINAGLLEEGSPAMARGGAGRRGSR